MRNKKLLWIAFTVLLVMIATIQFIPDQTSPDAVESAAEQPRAQRG